MQRAEDPSAMHAPRGLRLLALFIDWCPLVGATCAVASIAGLIAAVMAAEAAAGLAVYDPALGGDPVWQQVQHGVKRQWPLLGPIALYSLVNVAVGIRTGRTLGVRVSGWKSITPPTLETRRRALWFAVSLALSLALSGIACLLVDDAWGSGTYETPPDLWAGVSVGAALLQGLIALVCRALQRGVPLAVLPAFAALVPPGILALTLSELSTAWPEALCLLAEAATLLLLIRGRAVPNSKTRTGAAPA